MFAFKGVSVLGPNSHFVTSVLSFRTLATAGNQPYSLIRLWVFPLSPNELGLIIHKGVMPSTYPRLISI